MSPTEGVTLLHPEHHERLRFMEAQVTDLRVANAELTASVEHLTKTVEALTLTVQSLRDTINQGRGAAWIMVGAAGTAGAILGAVVKKVFGLL